MDEKDGLSLDPNIVGVVEKWFELRIMIENHFVGSIEILILKGYGLIGVDRNFRAMPYRLSHPYVHPSNGTPIEEKGNIGFSILEHFHEGCV